MYKRQLQVRDPRSFFLEEHVDDHHLGLEERAKAALGNGQDFIRSSSWVGDRSRLRVVLDAGFVAVNLHNWVRSHKGGS